jgi:hypothetical protein
MIIQVLIYGKRLPSNLNSHCLRLLRKILRLEFPDCYQEYFYNLLITEKLRHFAPAGTFQLEYWNNGVLE